MVGLADSTHPTARPSLQLQRRAGVRDLPGGGFGGGEVAVVGGDGDDHVSFGDERDECVPQRVRTVMPVDGVRSFGVAFFYDPAATIVIKASCVQTLVGFGGEEL